MLGWTTATGDPDNFFGPLFTCTAANGGSNSAKWCYPPFDKLILTARAESNHEKRVQLYKEAQQMMHDQMPAVMIAHSTIFEPNRLAMRLHSNQLELLSPARDTAIAREAILHGADAIYIGGPGFGARHNASNSLRDIAELVPFAHSYSAKVFVTLNYHFT
ncbi:unnamed protein product [Ranitomeya imitator]|uniref:Uncharacterized protein n=1 Tax=Ranitomeya imitator TaxID=111125 RepID=A0ABN9MGR7_9NEOB|nr:unnamed protein product [Ranitomeya imitator]